MNDRPVVVVTGAARGIGRAVTEGLHERGFQVIGVDLSEADREVCIPVAGDIARDETLAAVVSAVSGARSPRPVAGLVNCAAAFGDTAIEDISRAQWRRIFEVNVEAPFFLTQRLLPHLAEQASVVNVASISGLVGIPNQAAYSATKGALIQQTRQMAIELAPRGIRVNAVAPGAVDSQFTEEAVAAYGEDVSVDEVRQWVAESHPLRKIASPQEVAECVVFLLSSSASAVTGAILPVDAGYTAQ